MHDAAHISRFFVAIAMAGSLTGLGVALSPTASADTAAYLKHMADAGISTPGGNPELLEWGWESCALIDRGKDLDEVKDQAIYNSGRAPQYGLSVEQSDMILHFAITDLCADLR